MREERTRAIATEPDKWVFRSNFEASAALAVVLGLSFQFNTKCPGFGFKSSHDRFRFSTWRATNSSGHTRTQHLKTLANNPN